MKEAKMSSGKTALGPVGPVGGETSVSCDCKFDWYYGTDALGTGTAEGDVYKRQGDVRPEEVSGKYEFGVLKLRIPKKDSPAIEAPNRIAIE